MADMIDRIARIICPEAWDRDEFRRIVKRTNGGHTTGIDVEASMKEARNAARQTARDVLAEVRGIVCLPEMIEAGGEVISSDVYELSEWGTAPCELAERVYGAMVDAALAERPAPATPMEIASESVARLGFNNGVKQG